MPFGLGPSYMGVPATGAVPPVRAFAPIAITVPQQSWTISGITRDASGAALGGCKVILAFSDTEQAFAHTLSDANGAYKFFVNPASQFYAVAYLPGSPDVAGTTVNTLAGV